MDDALAFAMLLDELSQVRDEIEMASQIPPDTDYDEGRQAAFRDAAATLTELIDKCSEDVEEEEEICLG